MTEPTGEYFIGPQIIKGGLISAVDSFDSDEGRNIALQAAELVHAGNSEAYFVPAVKLLVDATLNVLTHPDAAPRSLEVADRQTTASFMATHLAGVAAKGLLRYLYLCNPALAKLSIPHSDIEGLDVAEYTGSLGAAPFFDARVVGGGAYRFLKSQGVENPIRIVKNSHNLLLIAGVYKDPEFTKLVHKALGSPYTDPENFELAEGTTDTEVRFTPSAAGLLKGLRINGRGCPAGKIKSPAAADRLLTTYWDRIIDFLIPEGATVDHHAADSDPD
jgi:hypothetical protein